jgi:riboflavin kinase / FMN adenylyltransferase
VPEAAYLYPGHGVYAARAAVPGRGAWLAAVNVGVRPTFDTGRGVLVEAHLLDFSGDLYGSELRLEFVRRLRGERRFASADALVEQMRKDVEDTKAAANLRRP